MTIKFRQSLLASKAGQEFAEVLLNLRMLITGMDDFWETDLFHKTSISKSISGLVSFSERNWSARDLNISVVGPLTSQYSQLLCTGPRKEGTLNFPHLQSVPAVRTAGSLSHLVAE